MNLKHCWNTEVLYIYHCYCLSSPYCLWLQSRTCNQSQEDRCTGMEAHSSICTTHRCSTEKKCATYTGHILSDFQIIINKQHYLKVSAAKMPDLADQKNINVTFVFTSSHDTSESSLVSSVFLDTFFNLKMTLKFTAIGLPPFHKDKFPCVLGLFPVYIGIKW